MRESSVLHGLSKKFSFDLKYFSFCLVASLLHFWRINLPIEGLELPIGAKWLEMVCVYIILPNFL